MSTQPRREPDRQPDRQPGNGAGNGPGNGPGSGPRRGPRSGSRRPLRPTRVAALVVVVLLILEVLAIRFVALQIGGGLTFLLLVATSVLGGWVVTREGRRRWQALGDAVRAGRPPQREVADGVLVLIGGLLLLLPGFVSDVLGILLVLPATRALARRLLVPVLGRHLLVRVGGASAGAGAAGMGFRRMRGASGQDQVIQGHVVSDDAVQGEVFEGEVVEGDVAEGHTAADGGGAAGNGPNRQPRRDEDGRA